MPTGASDNAGADGRGGSTYNTARRYTGNDSSGGRRRTSAQRANPNRQRNASDFPISDEGASRVGVEGKESPLFDARPAAAVQAEPSQQRVGEDALPPRTAPSVASVMRELNPSSPAFVPSQSQQRRTDTKHTVSNPLQLSFSTNSSSRPLFSGQSGGSSISSPLTFVASPRVDPYVATASPFHTALSTKTDSSTTFASGLVDLTPYTATGSAFVGTQTSYHLRCAYARVTAAAGAANREAASPQLYSHTDPAISIGLVQTSQMAGMNAPVAATQPSQRQLPAQQRPQQETSHHVSGAAATAASNPVYGPSVPVFHPQFVDVATGSVSMRPPVLLEGQSMGSGPAGGEPGTQWEQTEEVSAPITVVASTAESQLPSPRASARGEKNNALATCQPFPIATATPRISANTVAVLTAQEALLREAAARRAGAAAASRPMSPYMTAKESDNGAARRSTARYWSENDAKPATGSQRRVCEPANVPVGASEADTHQTPKRCSSKISATLTGPTNVKGHCAASLGVQDNLPTVERLYKCLSSTEERTEGGRAGSMMGLTGSTRRGLADRGDGEDDDGGEGMIGGTVTPTATPAKVLATEDSPFVVAAAAGDATENTSGNDPYPQSLSRDSETMSFIEWKLRNGAQQCVAQQQQQHRPESVQHNNGGDAQLQRSVMHLLAQIQKNGAKASFPSGAVNSPATITPQKPSSRRMVAVVNESGLSTTSAAFQTPEVERVPSARPSASKSATGRIITTIIHTPNTATKHRPPNAESAVIANLSTTMAAAAATSTASRRRDVAPNESTVATKTKGSRTATAKGAQRSLTSCLDAIASPDKDGALTEGTAAEPRPDTSAQAHPTPSSTASSTSCANSAVMQVPRSQRRSARQAASSSHTTTALNLAGSTQGVGTGGTTTAQPPSVAQNTRYAVVIEGHMQRRVTTVSMTPLKEGICVLFEEDRGIDLGRVVQCDVLDGDETAGQHAMLASATSPLSRKDRPAPVLRPATAEEEYRWLYADVKEAEATLEPCREAAARLGLPVTVVAAVYQFNKAKLTFYYESPNRVDFRPLLPSLFSRFHCRIWMSRIEATEPDCSGAIAAARAREDAALHAIAERKGGERPTAAS